MPQIRSRLPPALPLAVLVALPGTYRGAAGHPGLPHPEPAPPPAAPVFGLAIIGAVFVLSWAAEGAQGHQRRLGAGRARAAGGAARVCRRLLSAETDRVVILALSALYGGLSVAQFLRHRRELVRTTRDGLVTPFEELADADRVAASR